MVRESVMGKQGQYYNKRGVRITDQGFMTRGGTYLLSSITDTNVRIEAPQRTGPFACIAVGIVLCMTIVGAIVGVPVVIGGLIWLARQKPTHWLVLQTPAGQCEPYSSKDLKTVREIQAALVAAIAQSLALGPAKTQWMPIQQSDLKQNTLMTQLLQAAQRRNGKLSVTEGVIETEASFPEVESALMKMVKAGYVSVENHPETGIVLYKFTELA
jgi:hypothetical protein